MQLNGRVGAITGAASGIGRALACQLAARGMDLALSDVDEAGLAETVDLAKVAGAGATITSQRLDVADREAVHAWADRVVTDHGRANLIVNNAGVAVVSTIDGMSYDDFDWLMDINFHGVVSGTRAFLPHLKAAGEGHVVNISSVFGLMGIPSQSAYNAAKFAVRGFTEALRVELDMERCGVSASTVHPGGIKTNIARSARMDGVEAALGRPAAEVHEGFDRAARTTPAEAAEIIIKGIEENRRRILVGADARVISLLSKLPPGAYQGLLAKGASLRR
ncbi:MAG: SDR family NAD(P)-dependent oxidoreductase [Acidimicrobiales bacterium]|nr:SDR family NAD(P)-dependent oxidoreductase [Acidimicrobiales bacterium]